MAYCRWSCMDYQCDIYLYLSCHDREDEIDLLSLNIARNKRVFDIELPALPDVNHKDFLKIYNKRHDILDRNSKLIKIDLPYAGLKYMFSPKDCIAKLQELKKIGYKFPDYVIDDLKEEFNVG